MGTVAFGVIAILVTWSSIKVVQTNYELQKQLSVLRQRNEVQQLENENLKLKNQYLNTDEYLELAARRQFNKAAPGEKLLIVPKEVALKHTIDVKTSDEEAVATETETASGSKYERNFNDWLDFLFHRQSN